MNWLRVTGLAGIIAFLVGCAYCLTSGVPTWASSRSPRLNLPTCRTTDLGTGKVGEILAGTLAIGNDGGAPLEYLLEGGCSCTSLSPDKGVVNPGETTLVKVAVRLRTEGRDEVVVVRIRSNDADIQEASFTFTARCPSKLSSLPEFINLGTIKKGDVVTSTIELIDENKKPWKNHDKLHIESSDASLTTAWSAEPSGKLIVKIGPLPSGSFSGMLRIKRLDIPGHELQVPIQLEAVGRLVVVPPTLFLKAGNESESYFIIRSGDRGLVGSLDILDLPSCLKIEEVKNESTLYKRFRVVLLKGTDTLNQPTPYVVRVRSADSNETASINIEVKQ